MLNCVRQLIPIASLAVMAATPGASYAQPLPGNPHFEVASIKLAPPNRPGRPSFRSDPGRVDFRQTSLPDLLQRAYAAPWYQFVWVNAVDSGGRKLDPHVPRSGLCRGYRQGRPPHP